MMWMKKINNIYIVVKIYRKKQQLLVTWNLEIEMHLTYISRFDYFYVCPNILNTWNFMTLRLGIKQIESIDL